MFMPSLPAVHPPQDSCERFGNRLCKHIAIHLGEGTGDHEGSDVRTNVGDMGQAHVA
jgi:hypothetical protein